MEQATDLPQENDDVNNIDSVDNSQEIASIGDTSQYPNQDPTGHSTSMEGHAESVAKQEETATNKEKVSFYIYTLMFILLTFMVWILGNFSFLSFLCFQIILIF